MNLHKRLRNGCLLSGAIVLLFLCGALVTSLAAYDGNCISFEPPPEPCTLGEYLPIALLLLIVSWLTGKPLLTLWVLLLLICIPLIGLLADVMERRAIPPV